MQIVSTIPETSATNVSRTASIEIQFDSPVLASSVTDSSVVVYTKKTNVVQPTLVKPSSVIDNSKFLSDGGTSVVIGKLSVDGNRIIFKPAKPLEAKTEYIVTVSNTISSVSGELLGKIKTFKFLTTDEDVNIEEITQPLRHIIGTYVDFGSGFVSPDDLTLLYSEPKNRSLLFDSIIDLYFSDSINLNSAVVEVYEESVLSDEPPSLLESDLSADGNHLAVDINVDLPINTFITVKIKSLQSTSGKSLKEPITLSFVTELSPYYGSTKILRLKAGTLFDRIDDAYLAMLIHFNSMEIDEKMSSVPQTDGLDAVKIYYTTYASLYNALLNNSRYELSRSIKKQLGDFAISVDNGHKIDLYNKLLTDCKRALDIVDLYVLRGAVTYAVRNSIGSMSPGRLWFEGVQPGLNVKEDVGLLFRRYMWDELGIPANWNYLQ